MQDLKSKIKSKEKEIADFKKFMNLESKKNALIMRELNAINWDYLKVLGERLAKLREQA
jgi:hypothetical protein